MKTKTFRGNLRPTIKSRVFDFIHIDEYSSTSKYKQLANCILQAVEIGKIKKDDPLPSIGDLTYYVDISKDTVEKAYRYLREKGVVKAVPAIGYFVVNTEFKQRFRICLLFNNLSVHKKMIYDSFVEKLGKDAVIDFYIYNSDILFFKKIISDKLDRYTHYVIIPHFVEGEEFASPILNMIPKEKLILLDKDLGGVNGDYSSVFEDFCNDILNALQEASSQLKRYKTLKIVFPEYTYFPKEILAGFKKFCRQHRFESKVVSNISYEEINDGDVYINLDDEDLVILVEKIMEKKFVVGKHVGIISYNETPLKKFLVNGLTTISTDFKKMGYTCAELILNNVQAHIPIPFRLNMRSSL